MVNFYKLITFYKKKKFQRESRQMTTKYVTNFILFLLMVNIMHCVTTIKGKGTFKCEDDPHKRVLAELKPDPGCSYQNPARCPDIVGIKGPQCHTDYKKCMVSSGCTQAGFETRCITGECVSHVGFCPYNTKDNQPFRAKCPSEDENTNIQRCPDGICRVKTACGCLSYSGCRFGMYQCPDGRCKETAMECLGFTNCGPKKPFFCKSGYCVSDTSKCIDNLSGASFSLKEMLYEPNDNQNRNLDKTMMINIRNSVTNRKAIVVTSNLYAFLPTQNSPYFHRNRACLAKAKKLFNYKKANPKMLQSKFSHPTFQWQDDKNRSRRQLIRKHLWTDLDKCYKIKRLTKPAKLKVTYVSSEDVRRIKNKPSRDSLMKLESITKTSFSSKVIPGEIGYYSSVIKISTDGRHDDNDWFLDAPLVEFTSQGCVAGDENSVSCDVKMFNERFCLARADLDSNEWKCVSRKPSQYIPNFNLYNKELENKTDKWGPIGTNHIHDVSFSPAYIQYKIPFPGTYVILLSPKTDRLKASGIFGGVPPLLVIGGFLVTMIIIIGGTIWFFHFLSEEQVTMEKLKIAEFKYNAVKSTNPNYKGQTHMERLEEPV